ncbi:MAG: hypothetical protein NVSMB55_25750 [Mycobacteriales bacterium]
MPAGSAGGALRGAANGDASWLAALATKPALGTPAAAADASTLAAANGATNATGRRVTWAQLSRAHRRPSPTGEGTEKGTRITRQVFAGDAPNPASGGGLWTCERRCRRAELVVDSGWAPAGVASGPGCDGRR